MAVSQVAFDHARVLDHHGGRINADHAAPLDDHEPVRELGENLHEVLDDEDGEAELTVDAAAEFERLPYFGRAKARHRLPPPRPPPVGGPARRGAGARLFWRTRAR